MVVAIDPVVQVFLQFCDAAVDLLTEVHLVKLVQHRLVEALTDAIGLRVAHLGLGVFDLVQGQVQLVVMVLRLATVFGAPVSQDSDDAHSVFFHEWKDTVVEQVCSGDRRLGRIELGGSPLGIGVDKGLLVDPANALDRSHIEGVLAPEIAGVRGLDFTAGHIVVLLTL